MKALITWCLTGMVLVIVVAATTLGGREGYYSFIGVYAFFMFGLWMGVLNKDFLLRKPWLILISVPIYTVLRILFG